MKKFRKNKKAVLATSVALVAIMVLSATFAWFSAQDSVDNKFKTGGIPDGTVKVWEVFEKPTEWKPGQEVNKDVAVVNFGKEPIFVRATFDEAIQKLVAQDNDELKVLKEASIQTDEKKIAVPTLDFSNEKDWKEAKDAGFTVNGLDPKVKLYVKEVVINKDTTYMFAAMTELENGEKGKVNADFKVNEKNIEVSNVEYLYYEKADIVKKAWTTEKPSNNAISVVDNMIELKYHPALKESVQDNSWYYNAEDGWFYYVGRIEAGAISPMLLDSVTLKKEAGNTHQFMDYTLTVKVEGLQATKAALESWNITEDNPLFAGMTKGLTETK